MPSTASNHRSLRERALFRPLSVILLALALASLCSAVSLPASAAGVVRLPGHVPGAAISAARLTGNLPGQQTVQLAFVLPLRNQAGLQQLITRLYDPKDPLYGHFLTPSQFRDQFGPSASDVSTVKAYASSLGLTVTGVSSNNAVVDVSGQVARVNSGFALHLRSYEKADGSRFYAPDMDPAVRSDIASRIAGIVGFDNLPVCKPLLQRPRPKAPGALAARPVIGHGVDASGLDPDDIKAAYNLTSVCVNNTAGSTGLSGSGQVLGLIELDGYDASDVTTYESTYFNNLYTAPVVAPTLTNVAVDGGTTASGSDGQDEVTLDIELQIALAPLAKEILVYEAPNTAKSFVDLIQKDATDNLATSSSMSWEIPEDELSQIPSVYNGMNTALQEMATQGQSFYHGSGDTGAFDDRSEPTTVVANDSTEPYETSVGGTRLSVNSDGSYNSETTWNELSFDGGAGGGGISIIWPIPSYQTAIVDASSDPELSKTMRNVPDVSLDADPETGYSIYTQGAWEEFGGTSCAGPLWAAFTELINQERATAGSKPIGFINPTLYEIAALPENYASDFHDIANDSNNGYYHAETGYDDATGLGTFNGANLLSDAFIGGVSLSTTITGQVTTPGVGDGVSAQPVQGAVVTETFTNEVGSFGSQPRYLQTATTDSNGDYTIAAPANSFISLQASLTGYVPASVQVTTGATGSTLSNINLSLSVSPYTFDAATGPVPFQMISLPYVYSVADSIPAILGYAEPAPTVYYWWNLYGEYVSPPIGPAQTFTIGDGYWLGNSQPVSVAIVGTPVTASTFGITLSKGWNMIGDPYDASVELSNVTVTPSGSTTSESFADAVKAGAVSILYSWQSTDTSNYETIDASGSLTPWWGYWIKSNSAGVTLNVPNPGS